MMIHYDQGRPNVVAVLGSGNEDHLIDQYEKNAAGTGGQRDLIARI
jgi:hypothetical protein